MSKAEQREASCRQSSVAEYHSKILLALSYKVGQTIGKGNYAEVKIAWCFTEDKEVAVKIVDKKKKVTKFLPREVANLQELKHPHILETYMIADTTEYCYIAMEFAHNGDLHDYISEIKVPLLEAEARYLFRQISTGVAYCHSKGIIHRDLKCENIMLDYYMNAKIGDFGFSLNLNTDTATTPCGSTLCCAPEVRKKAPYDGKKADIWSLGLVLYFMLVCRVPPNMHITLKFPTHITFLIKTYLKSILKHDPSTRPSIEGLMEGIWLQVPYQLKPESLAIRKRRKGGKKKSASLATVRETCATMPPSYFPVAMSSAMETSNSSTVPPQMLIPSPYSSSQPSLMKLRVLAYFVVPAVSVLVVGGICAYLI